VVPNASGPANEDGIGTTGTTRARTVVPTLPERKAQQSQQVVEDGTSGTTGTTQIEVIRANEAKPGSGPALDAADWQAYFDERAAIREHNGEFPRAEAERLAFVDTVAHWLCLHPAPATDPHRGCVQCGRGHQANDTLLPVLAPSGHVWVHDQCWEAWNCSRRHQAEGALQELRARRDRT
jgi:hypothetical protein